MLITLNDCSGMNVCSIVRFQLMVSDSPLMGKERGYRDYFPFGKQKIQDLFWGFFLF